MIGKVNSNANYHLHPNIQDVSFLCVNLEVLKTTTNSNTNIYHPNTAIGDDVWLLRVSFNSTLESLPYLCTQPLTGNSFAIDRLGNLPGHFLCS
jgi:hypothetical protein